MAKHLPHLVSHLVPTPCPYTLSKATGELTDGLFPSSSSSPGTADPAGTAGGRYPKPASIPYYWREQVVDAASSPRLSATSRRMWRAYGRQTPCSKTMSRPFRASCHFGLFPRALPWAGMLCPFRAFISLGTSCFSHRTQRSGATRMLRRNRAGSGVLPRPRASSSSSSPGTADPARNCRYCRYYRRLAPHIQATIPAYDWRGT